MSNAQSVLPPFFRIALDVGFHSFKVSAVYAGKLYTFTMPSVVGVGETSLGLLQTGITRQKRNLPFLVTFDNQSLKKIFSNFRDKAKSSLNLNLLHIIE